MLGRSMLRGAKGRCPHCGEGRLFWRYLKVKPSCSVCDHDLDRYPADDGPAYFTILIVGHLVVAPLLVFSIIWEAPTIYVVPATLIPLAVITLTLLPIIKGAFIGLLYTIARKEGAAALHLEDVPQPRG